MGLLRGSGIGRVVVVAGIVSCFSVTATAQAGTTIGDTTANAGVICVASGVNLLNTAVAGPPTYAVPAGGGVITAWSWRAGATPGSGKLLVLEPTAPPSYTVVGKSSERTFTAGQLHSFPTRIPVSQGDLVGFRATTSGMNCAFNTGDAGDILGVANSPEPEAGSAETINPALGGSRVPVSAVVETDGDGDGFGDESQDNCPGAANPDQADRDDDALGDACDGDDDGDGVADESDNCRLDANPDQADRDGDGVGNACDPDSDGDGINDGDDNCPRAPNPDQADSNGNGTGDACDTPTSPGAPDTTILKAKSKVKTAKRKGTLTASFESDQDGVEFRCKLDSGATQPCTSPVEIKAKLGKHSLRITAIGPGGLTDPFPATHRFKVVPKR